VNGRDLTLGLVGALAVGAALGRRGSPNLPTRSVVLRVATPREIQRAYAAGLDSDWEVNPPVVWPSFDDSTGLTLWDDLFGNLTEIFWGEAEPFDPSSALPFRKAEELWTRFSILPAYFNRLRFPLRVYRGLRISPGYTAKTQAPGPHGTVNSKIALRFATGEHEAATQDEDAEGVVLEGIVERPEDVNWRRTLTDYLMYSDDPHQEAEEQINSTKVTRVSARMLE
jgi:hypothetical protein